MMLICNEMPFSELGRGAVALLRVCGLAAAGGVPITPATKPSAPIRLLATCPHQSPASSPNLSIGSHTAAYTALPNASGSA